MRFFLSYARAEALLARALAADLHAIDQDVWLDNELSGGENWWKQILTQIRECEAFIFALSSESLSSAACHLEWLYASDLHKQILPILVADCGSINLLPPQLAQIQHVDYRRQDKQSMIELVKALNRLPPTKPLPEPLPPEPEIPISSLGLLQEKIQARKNLSFEEQSGLLIQIRQGLRNSNHQEDIRKMLLNFRRREDLLARVAEEIDELLNASTAIAQPFPPHMSVKESDEKVTSAARLQATGRSIPVQASSGENRAPAGGGEVPGIEITTDSIMRGIHELASRVRICFGPSGRAALIPQGLGEPALVGTALEAIQRYISQNSVEGAGAKLLKQTGLEVHAQCGSGSGTTIILSQSLYQSGRQALARQVQPPTLISGIEAFVRACIKELEHLAKPCGSSTLISSMITTLEQGNEEVAQAIVSTIDQVGQGAPVVISDHPGMSIEVSVVEGISFDRGFLSTRFANDRNKECCVLNSPYVLLCNQSIEGSAELVPLLEAISHENRALLVVAEDVTGDALYSLVNASASGAPPCCAVKAPGFGDRRLAILEDLAILTGGEVINTQNSLENASLSDLGSCMKVEVNADSTALIDAKGNVDSIRQRLEDIRECIDSTDSDYDREKLQERLARMAGGAAVIGIGGRTEAERDDRTERATTALKALRAALLEGVVAGGGHALLRAAHSALEQIPEGERGVETSIVVGACEEPLRQLALNAGKDGNEVIDEVLRDDRVEYGFDAATGSYGDLYEAGIVDSLLSAKLALEKAAEASTKLLWSSSVTSG